MNDRTKMLEATLNLMDEGVAILDENSRILFWNHTAAALTGYSSEDLVDQRCPDHLYQIDEEHQCGVDPISKSRRQSTSPEIDADLNLLQWPTLVSFSHRLG